MSKHAPTFVFAGGGTGGHLFPGIAVAQELRSRLPAARIVFVGTLRGIERTQVPRYGFELELLPVRPLRGRSPRERLLGAATLPRAIGSALALMWRLRPQVVVSVGGYAAGPATLAARALGVPCAVMEQNAFAGVTNRLLSVMARHVLLALPNRQLDGHPGARLVGNPVRADLLAAGAQALPAFAAPFTPSRPLRVLAFGGSQGARALNEALMALVPKLSAANLPVSVQHQTGAADEARVQACYRQAGVPPTVASATRFVDDMAAALCRADVLLCRSGASTLAEAAVVGRASWLVPYPHAADDHQTANAKVFVEAGAARMLPEAELSAAQLLQWIEQGLAAPASLLAMAKAARSLARPRAVHDIADVLQSECGAA